MSAKNPPTEALKPETSLNLLRAVPMLMAIVVDVIAATCSSWQLRWVLNRRCWWGLQSLIGWKSNSGCHTYRGILVSKRKLTGTNIAVAYTACDIERGSLICYARVEMVLGRILRHEWCRFGLLLVRQWWLTSWLCPAMCRRVQLQKRWGLIERWN